ncbi:MAG TPA: flagellin [Planctomycetaceae bacterium]|nr:flagellin [Planctomycetaceae bacterium]
MSRVGAVNNLSAVSLQLLRGLSTATRGVDQSTLRLSTLKKINSSADDPAGMMVASRLQTELDSVAAVSSNILRAKSLIATADTAASGIVDKLGAARVIALEVAGGTLSAADKLAKQTELDDLLDGIDRSAKAEYDGKRLLDGSSGYSLSGVNATQFLDVDVVGKPSTSNVTVNVNVTTTALKGTKDYDDGALASDTTLEITGSEGTAVIELESGATTQEITDAFNSVSHLTGVTATRVDASDIDFSTTKYGSDATISITATSGTFATTGTGTGRDAVATVNGRSHTANGTAFSVATGQVSLQFDIAAAASGALTAFTVSGNGLEFQVSPNVTDTARIGLATMTASSLGGTTGKLSSIRSGQANDLSNDPLTTMQIIDEALSEALTAQARIGSFSKYTLDSAASLLDTQTEQLSAAHSDLMDVNIAEETARLTAQRMQQESALQAMQIFQLRSDDVLSMLQSLALRS